MPAFRGTRTTPAPPAFSTTIAFSAGRDSGRICLPGLFWLRRFGALVFFRVVVLCCTAGMGYAELIPSTLPCVSVRISTGPATAFACSPFACHLLLDICSSLDLPYPVLPSLGFCAWLPSWPPLLFCNACFTGPCRFLGFAACLLYHYRWVHYHPQLSPPAFYAMPSVLYRAWLWTSFDDADVLL